MSERGTVQGRRVQRGPGDGETRYADSGHGEAPRARQRGAGTGNPGPRARPIPPEPGQRWREPGTSGAHARPGGVADPRPDGLSRGTDRGRHGVAPGGAGHGAAEHGHGGWDDTYVQTDADSAETEAGYGDWPDGYDDPDEGYGEFDADGGYHDTAAYHVAGPPGYGAEFASGRAHGHGAAAGRGQPDERTEVLINRGRRHARPTGLRRWTRHWRAIAVGAGGVTAGAIAVAVIVSGGSPSWPASVAVVQREITAACENPNVVSEPTQVNFACAKDTSSILWVFSLLTSDDNPNFSDRANGRQGLEPITPAQGGEVAWSLNLHHPYNPANPADSLAVAARAINDIIGGATLTGTNGAPEVQPGLESNPANCQRYTGSSAIVTHQGFPAICAQPVTSPAGEAALVSDVFKQWMLGTPAQLADDAGVLFENAGNPGNPQVQAIVNSLSQSRL